MKPNQVSVPGSSHRRARKGGSPLLDDTLVLVMSEFGRSWASRGSNGTYCHEHPEGIGVHLR
jgi:uncharacterized protein (DUF1501 family)